ncbi:DUF7523 family protein [Halovivax limisalsi]|uniref:DUF7523 family protein n=1 Tax=Halovivax limisalsi TaxID=1453760 RepID=UPI001FFC8821|nr:hypothetical protein [Halovivax limisalsi]
MSLAAQTRAAVEDYPFLVDALRAGVCNYTALARFLDVDGEVDAVATALRRYAEDLPPLESTERDVRVTMQSGIEPVERQDETLLQVGETRLGAGAGDRTAIVASGEVDATGVATAIERCALADVEVRTAAFDAGSAAVFVVPRRDGANGLRVIESAFASVPTSGS